MKVERNTPVRATRSVAQAAYARRVEGAASANLDEVGPAASCWASPNPNSPQGCATPSWA